MATLADLTSVLRSKNAGALLCTLDLMFEDECTYIKVRAFTVCQTMKFLSFPMTLPMQ